MRPLAALAASLEWLCAGGPAQWLLSPPWLPQRPPEPAPAAAGSGADDAATYATPLLLPVELWAAVFRRLAPPDLLTVPCVCRLWRDMYRAQCGAIWRERWAGHSWWFQHVTTHPSVHPRLVAESALVGGPEANYGRLFFLLEISRVQAVLCISDPAALPAHLDVDLPAATVSDRSSTGAVKVFKVDRIVAPAGDAAPEVFAAVRLLVDLAVLRGFQTAVVSYGRASHDALFTRADSALAPCDALPLAPRVVRAIFALRADSVSAQINGGDWGEYSCADALEAGLTAATRAASPEATVSVAIRVVARGRCGSVTLVRIHQESHTELFLRRLVQQLACPSMQPSPVASWPPAVRPLREILGRDCVTVFLGHAAGAEGDTIVNLARLLGRVKHVRGRPRGCIL